MTFLRNTACAIVTFSFLTACGDKPGERALTGGAIGAGVGALGSSLVGGNAVSGALVGGAVGAGTGALTKKKDINLGNSPF